MSLSCLFNLGQCASSYVQSQIQQYLTQLTSSPTTLLVIIGIVLVVIGSLSKFMIVVGGILLVGAALLYIGAIP